MTAFFSFIACLPRYAYIADMKRAQYITDFVKNYRRPDIV